MNSLKRTGKRMLALLLCLTLALSVPVMPAPSAQAIEADHWLAPYLDKMTSWDIVKGDGNGDYHTEDNITRAEFVAMLNRAYGYTDVGPIPFTDVGLGDWFYDDIRKAYTAGVFHGTSETTASPYDPITREQAVTLIARNMRMDETPGEIIDFTDGREFSYFSRGYVKSAIAAGIINGYTDGTVKPLNNVTRGEAIKMMCVGIGSLINTPGTHSPGGVFGNLTINCTNVTLKDTIITGDLYISGGISLGDVVLENVQVRGRIVVAGGGSSELGQNSVLLRGVDTSKLVVDAPTGQYISVRTEGRTHIDNAAFRSDSFFEDACRDGYGILNVSLEGAPGDSFTLSGNLENVVNRTPDSTLILGDAQASSVTVDEKATGSKLILEVNASADEVNLDVGTSVEGSGDIGHLTINSTGSSTTMLPDTITIRPGLNADIAGDDMDASEAEEYSEEPRILNGYPKVANVAPTTADGINSTNKQGTIYWGLTTAAVGAVPDTEEGRQSLISPSYGSGFLLSGSYPATSSEIDLTIPERLTGLTSSGTYFVSAVLQDVRGHVSPVYSERFETPDDIVPAFSSGDYPYMSSIEVEDPEVTVMANKNCDMYYALFPQGSTQPSVNDFLSFAGFDDALGYGRVRLTKNKTWTEQVNKIIYPESMDREDFYTGDLVERASYDLYLWLADADGIKSSAITKLTFTTRDKTPPEFTTDMQQTTMGATNVGVNCVINEAGTVHWALVKTGTEYPKLPKDWDVIYNNSIEEFLRSEEAKFQVSNHQNAFKTGSINTNGNADASANITGLERETAYDLYYVAVDSAGNYSDTVKKITVYTEDSTPPTATLAFSRVADSDSEILQPYADSDVCIVFSENILDRVTGAEPLELYQTMHSAVSSTTEKNRAKERLVSILGRMITMYQRVGNTPTKIDDIKWENAALELDRDGQMIITLPTTGANAAVTLGSGSQYYFAFQDITDASPQKNEMVQRETPMFTTVSAQAILNNDVISTSVVDGSRDDKDAIDMAFSIKPDSTDSSEAGLRWDMKLWFDASIEFDLYRRVRPEDPSSDAGWKPVNTTSAKITGVPTGGMRGITINSAIDGTTSNKTFLVRDDAPAGLKEGETWEYAIHVTKIGDQTERKNFTNYLTCQVQVLIGNHYNLLDTLNQASLEETADLVDKYSDVLDITYQRGFTINHQFRDGNAPQFRGGLPDFTPGDSGVTMHLALNRTGTVYYVLVPADNLRPEGPGGYLDMDTGTLTGQALNDKLNEGTNKVTTNGSSYNDELKSIRTPSVQSIMDPRNNFQISSGSNAVFGTVPNVTTLQEDVPVSGLKPETTYYAYFVIEGGSNTLSEYVQVYRFRTTEIVRPAITLNLSGSSVRVTSTHTGTVNYLVLPFTTDALTSLNIGDDYTTTPGEAEDKTDWADSTSGADMSAYKALAQNSTLPSTTGSEYDRAALDSHKRTLAEAIRSSNAGTGLTVGSGTLQMVAGVSQTVDCSQMDLAPDSSYIFLAVGSSNTGSADAFRAIYPVMLVDNTPPVVESISNALRVRTNGTITGQLVLNFSENIYYKDLSSAAAIAPKKFCFHETQNNVDSSTADPTVICSSPGIKVAKYRVGDHGSNEEPDSTQIFLNFENTFPTEKITLNRVITDKIGNRIGTITISFSVDADKNITVYVNNRAF